MRDLLKIALGTVKKAFFIDDKDLCDGFDLIIENYDQIKDEDLKYVKEIYELVRKIGGKGDNESLKKNALEKIVALNSKYGFKKDDSQRQEPTKPQEQSENSQVQKEIRERYEDLQSRVMALDIAYTFNHKIIESLLPIDVSYLFKTTKNAIEFLLGMVQEILEKNSDFIIAEIRMKDIESLIDTLHSLLYARDQKTLVEKNDSLCDQLASIAPLIEVEKQAKEILQGDIDLPKLQREYQVMCSGFQFLEYYKMFFNRDRKNFISKSVDIDAIYDVTHDAIEFLLESIDKQLNEGDNDINDIPEMESAKSLIETLSRLLCTRSQDDFIKCIDSLSKKILNLCTSDKVLGMYLEERLKNRQMGSM